MAKHDLLVTEASPPLPVLLKQVTGTILKAVSQSIEKGDPGEVGAAFKVLRNLSETLGTLEKMARDRIIAHLTDYGTRVADSKTLAAEVGGVLLQMHPHRSGTDPKKLEALLRTKGIEVSKYMLPDIKWKVEPGLLLLLVKHKAMTEDELKTCDYDESWSVSTPEMSKEKV